MSWLQRQIEHHLTYQMFRMPPSAARRFLDGPRLLDGQRLDDQFQMLLTLMERSGHPPLHKRGVEGARAEYRGSLATLARAPREVAEVFEDELAGCTVRVYHPRASSTPQPALLYFHGGGFVIGDLETHDPFCRRVALEANCVVIAVDYPLGPEHPLPRAQEAAVEVFRALVERASAMKIDPARIAVGGDSAGGLLAAVIAHQTRGDEVVPRLAWLIYPVVDLLATERSRGLFDRGFVLDADLMDWFSKCSMPVPMDRDDPRAAPIRDRLEGLPETHVVTAGFDPLRDEGEAYARALAEANVTVTSRRYATLIHGFITMTGCAAADAAVSEMCARLRGSLRS